MVVGGGPAGLATAIALVQSGRRVLVCEKRLFPVDKVCGEGIMPVGLHHLEQLGVRELIRDHAPFEGIHYYLQELEARGSFREGCGWGVRRTELSRALLEKARSLPGLTVLEKTGVKSLQRHSDGLKVGLAEGEVRARLVVGADGLNSSVRRWSGLQKEGARWFRWGASGHFDIAPWNSRVEVHWGESREAYVAPLSAHRIGVAFCWDRRRYPRVAGKQQLLESMLEAFPRLSERLRGRQASFRGLGPLQRRTRKVYAPGVALVGDAAGYLDAITGEGLSLAFGQALALARCVTEPLKNGLPLGPALRNYAVLHRQMVRPYYLVTTAVLWLTRSHRLARCVLPALAAEPDLFGLLLSANQGLVGVRPLLPGLIRLVGRVVGGIVAR